MASPWASSTTSPTRRSRSAWSSPSSRHGPLQVRRLWLGRHGRRQDRSDHLHHTDMYGQGYFQYDSKKSGGVDDLRPPLRPTPHPVAVLLRHGRFRRSPQALLHRAALHPRGHPRGGGTLPSTPIWKASEVFEHLTEDMQRTIIDKKVKVYMIDGLKIAGELGRPAHHSIMQACFFKLSGSCPRRKPSS